MRIALLLTGAAACSSASNAGPTLDGSPGGPDARPVADAPVDQGTGYTHTITIDGTDDFLAGEQFSTTSAAYGARVTWDANHVYVGYSGPDLDPAALDTGFKWLFVYFDFDPGAATGATTSLRYNTQAATFPPGFGAELYARWKADGSFASIDQRQPDGTYTELATPTADQAGTFVELAIPRVLLGGATTIGVVTWMINEKPDFEGSFAGLYPGNFADGYAATLPLTKYLRIDFASDAAPNDPANQAP